MRIDHLTESERLLMANQFKILAKLAPEQEEDYLQKAEIVEAGYPDLYHELFSGLLEETPSEVCEETHEILTMYRAINNVISQLTDEQKEALNLRAIEFDGFDANHDKHYYFMKFMLEKMDGMYEEYQGMYLNSHTATSLPRYKRIHEAYRNIIENNGYPLRIEHLPELINAVVPAMV